MPFSFSAKFFHSKNLFKVDFTVDKLALKSENILKVFPGY